MTSFRLRPPGSGTSRARGPQENGSFHAASGSGARCSVKMSLKEVRSAPSLEGASLNWALTGRAPSPELCRQRFWHDV